MTDPQSPDRRTFLKTLAGAGLILGLGRLGLGQDSSGKTPFEEALAKMKANRLEGLAIVIPSGAAAQEKLGKALEKLIPLPQHAYAAMPADGRLLLQVVWVCATPEECGAKPGESLVLLDPQGKRSDGLALDLCGKPEEVRKKLRAFLEGKGRLEARAKRALEDERVKEALDGLRDPKKRSEHSQVLRRHFDRAAPAILAQSDAEQDPEIQPYLAQILGETYWQRVGQGKAFPYGVSWRIDMNQPEPCPPCGMAAPSLSGRTFLKFLTR